MCVQRPSSNICVANLKDTCVCMSYSMCKSRMCVHLIQIHTWKKLEVLGDENMCIYYSFSVIS